MARYFTKEEIEEVKKIDLFTYLKNYEPDELEYHSNGTYKTKTHDSLIISNGLWHWFSEEKGGKDALNYLIVVRGYKFYDAVAYLIDKIKNNPCSEIQMENIQENETKEFILPKKSDDYTKVKSYLISRGISKNIIQECIDNGILYQENDTGNTVFLGLDEENIPKYAFIRGSNSSKFMHEASGSDKNYSFKIVGKERRNIVHLFESAIDLLSYATIQELNNNDWYEETLLSLAGVYRTNSVIDSKLPRALLHYINTSKDVSELILHFDNDKIGRGATELLKTKLKNTTIKIIDDPPKIGKDMNDFLCKIKGINRCKNSNLDREI